jgi:hypothetical protein
MGVKTNHLQPKLTKTRSFNIVLNNNNLPKTLSDGKICK